ncbi:FadR/GntR family transcriptional regulator [Catenulispora rubra]|uniref:FadR/GntR family transcriptional regulator n=1 Tax=Catenulispora rubra TaxID=280293 RepID=UPI0018922F1A|nr:FCD domain-containing protein [Catenulispora rubra]
MPDAHHVQDLITDVRASVVRDVVYSPIGGEALAHQVVRRIAEGIGVGILQPGDRLPPEARLASWLGVSVTVVREALSILRETGYVETVRGAGGGTRVRQRPAAPTDDEARTFLATFTPEHVSDFADLRVAISGEAAALAARRARADRLAQVSQLATQMKNAADFATYREIDARFHIAISASSGSARLATAEVRLQVELGEMLNAVHRLTPDMEIAAMIHTSDRDHEKIVRALQARDPERSRSAVAAHVIGIRDLFIAVAPRRDQIQG